MDSRNNALTGGIEPSNGVGTLASYRSLEQYREFMEQQNRGSPESGNPVVTGESHKREDPLVGSPHKMTRKRKSFIGRDHPLTLQRGGLINESNYSMAPLNGVEAVELSLDTVVPYSASNSSSSVSFEEMMKPESPTTRSRGASLESTASSLGLRGDEEPLTIDDTAIDDWLLNAFETPKQRKVDRFGGDLFSSTPIHSSSSSFVSGRPNQLKSPRKDSTNTICERMGRSLLEDCACGLSREQCLCAPENSFETGQRQVPTLTSSSSTRSVADLTPRGSYFGSASSESFGKGISNTSRRRHTSGNLAHLSFKEEGEELDESDNFPAPISTASASSLSLPSMFFASPCNAGTESAKAERKFSMGQLPTPRRISKERRKSTSTGKVCFRRLWTPEEDEKLAQLVGDHGPKAWTQIAKFFKDKTSNQCSQRWHKALDPSIKKGKWSAEEDEALRKAVAKHGKSWKHVAKEITGRTGKQCRDRYISRLDPEIKVNGKWTKEEDQAMMNIHSRLGNKWVAIQKHLPHRSWYAIKWRIESLKRQKLYSPQN